MVGMLVSVCGLYDIQTISCIMFNVKCSQTVGSYKWQKSKMVLWFLCILKILQNGMWIVEILIEFRIIINSAAAIIKSNQRICFEISKIDDIVDEWYISIFTLLSEKRSGGASFTEGAHVWRVHQYLQVDHQVVIMLRNWPHIASFYKAPIWSH